MASDEHEDLWEILGNMPVRIWFCPDRRQHERDRNHEPPNRPTVEWRDKVAHCLEPGCGNKSTDKKEER